MHINILQNQGESLLKCAQIVVVVNFGLDSMIQEQYSNKLNHL
jgi:hypothetical protein